jgi:hypothetical protein
MPVYPDSDRRSDYSNVDLIVAIRSFDGRSYDHKPATKLHNAWRAGVPAILGPESAYRQEGSESEDYLEARTYEELHWHVSQLCERPALREQIRERSQRKGSQIKPAYKVQKWWNLLTGPITDAYLQWKSSSSVRQKLFLMKRWASVKKNSLAQRIGV